LQEPPETACRERQSAKLDVGNLLSLQSWDAALFLLEHGADIDVRNKDGATAAVCIAAGKRATEETLQKPLPDSLYKVKAAFERRHSIH
jgi:hypothetical protein